MILPIGPDISFYQDNPQTPFTVDFRKMKERSLWVVIRAGQNLWGDRDFVRNWKEAKKAGIPRGAYWFYDSRVDPKKQAEKFVSMFAGDFGELPIFADFEDEYNGPFKGWKNWYNFIERLRQLLPKGKEIGIYTGYYYWREHTVGAGIEPASLEYFQQYPLWIANYGVASPLVPKPWKTWVFWQYTDNGDGTLYGVESLNIDLNYFNGDADAFYRRFNLTLQAEGEKPNLTIGVHMYQFERAGTAGAALRSLPRVDGKLEPYPEVPSTLITSAGYVTDKTPVKGDVIITLTEDIYNSAKEKIGYKNDKWLHVVEVGGYVVDSYTAVIHKGVPQGELKEIIVDETPVPTPTPTPVPVPAGSDKYRILVDPEKKIITLSFGQDADANGWRCFIGENEYIKAP